MTNNRIAIIGGGLNGFCLAAILTKMGFDISLICKSDLKPYNHARIDGRAIALARGSKIILEKYCLYTGLENFAGNIDQIRVQDYKSPFYLDFDDQMKDEPMGHIIELDDLLNHFAKKSEESGNMTYFSNHQVIGIREEGNNAVVQTDQGKNIYADLVIAADGKNSHLRKLMAIDSYKYSYSQRAIVGRIHHSKPHNNIAYENFYRSGPIAFLPFKDQNFSSLVWTIEEDLANQLLTPDHELLNELLNDRFGGSHGQIQFIGPLNSYPLSLVMAKKYFTKKLCFVGDSLHFIHPIAGQGFNLSMRDIDVLSNLLVRFREAGQKISSPVLFKQFESLRSKDNWLMALATHGLNNLFATSNPFIKTTRNLGLEVVENWQFLKKRFISHAMGRNQS